MISLQAPQTERLWIMITQQANTWEPFATPATSRGSVFFSTMLEVQHASTHSGSHQAKVWLSLQRDPKLKRETPKPHNYHSNLSVSYPDHWQPAVPPGSLSTLTETQKKGVPNLLPSLLSDLLWRESNQVPPEKNEFSYEWLDNFNKFHLQSWCMSMME